MVPREVREGLERFQKSNQKKLTPKTHTPRYDRPGWLLDSPPRVRGFEQLKIIIEQETAVAAIVVAVVDVVADFVAVVVVVFVVVVVAVFVLVAVVANVVVDVVFLLLLFLFFYTAMF